MSKVNLDALIPREDFQAKKDQSQSGASNPPTGLQLTELKNGAYTYSVLRKPDFQRETSEWEPEKVCGLIESFVNDDLIPAVILWRSAGSYIFVIDGSHRLSALVAWVNDDYGDGFISRKFYGEIPEQQIKIANQTRKLVQTKIGGFKDFELAPKEPASVRPEIVSKARNLPGIAITLQWLGLSVDAKKAESSFLKINKEAAPVNATELKLIECRNKPNGIAARAIIRSGSGHKYWAKFPETNATEVINLASEINKMLFTPPYKDPIKTLDLPVGGKIYSAQTLPLIVEFINIVNGIDRDKKVKDNILSTQISEDETGENTIQYLKNVKKIAMRINSADPSSLGLHPAVYFYSREGKYKVASFYAIIALIMEFELHKSYKKFTDIRSEFENFLIKNDNLVQQIVRKYRSASNGYLKIKDFYQVAINLIQQGEKDKSLINKILRTPELQFIQFSKSFKGFDKDVFTREKKSEIFLKEALSKALRCDICKGYIHLNSISFDHINNKKDGGRGTLENGQLTHPYCNSIKK